jgi:FlaA1/EpsC-like NDP-sugar epimerase
MPHPLLRKYAHRHVPRWSVLVFDVLVIFLGFYLAFAVRVNFETEAMDLHNVGPQAIFTTLVYAVCFLLYGSYSGIIRHTGFQDAYRLFQAMGTGFLVTFGFAVVVRTVDLDVPWTTSFSVLLIHFLVAYFTLMASRVTIKSVYAHLMRSRRKSNRRVIIFGAGQAGMITRNALVNDPLVGYKVVAFADDNPEKVNKRLEGVPVFLPEYTLSDAFVKSSRADLLIVSIQQLDPVRRREVIELALEREMEVKVVPPLDRWIDGQLSPTQLKDVRIEELMERDPIFLDSSRVAADLHDKVVLITGAAGSIGGGLARQVLPFGPRKLLLLDQAETDLFELQFGLQSELQAHPTIKKHLDNVEYIVGNIRDKGRMERLFGMHRPDIVYHAAAYKHVPLMEGSPYEALLVNVFGTQVLADLAVQYGCGKFVMISSDKAVNPTSVMGATKRLAEIYTQSLGSVSTQFITTRFGNVLDSQGSVIPLFRRQIEGGGPVTVTHPDISRYFMLINEACQLVLEAGSIGNGGDILVFDMGQPVRIIDMARKMIRLSGLEPGKDIEIQITGIRPGEKLYEEVLDPGENTLPTHHPKILHARVKPYGHAEVVRHFGELHALLSRGEDNALVAKMKEIVPEYKSQNSRFSALD